MSIKPYGILEAYNAFVNPAPHRMEGAICSLAVVASGYVTVVCFSRELGISVRSECYTSLWGTPILRWSISIW